MAIKNVDATTLKQWLAENKAVLIDVRETNENACERIKQAHNIPLNSISVDKLPDYQDKKLVIHCHLGKRSMAACLQLTEEMPSLEVYNLEGGISAWTSQGLPVESGTK